MNDTFNGKRYVVTGGASGIGFEVAKLLHRRGAQVALWDNNRERLQTAVETEASALVCVVDVTDPAQIDAATQTLIAHWGGIDGVIHCAGIAKVGVFSDHSVEQFRRVVEVNLFGTIATAHTFIPYLKTSHGSLILLASVSGFYGSPEFAVYGATKAGILNFAQALRIELHGTGVHVGIVCPHFVDTALYRAEALDARLAQARSPLVELKTAAQIAPSILRGIERGAFMIYPSWRARLIFTTSRYLHAFSHRAMLQTWRS